MDEDCPEGTLTPLGPDGTCGHGIRHRGVHSCCGCCRKSPEARAADELAALTEELGLYG